MNAMPIMRQLKRLSLVLALVLGAILWWKFSRERGLDVTWHADVEATLAKITEVPAGLRSSYDLPTYRKRIREVCSNLQVTLYSNGHAYLSGGVFPQKNAHWRRDDKFDYWIENPDYFLFVRSGIGHGFSNTTWNQARIAYQLESQPYPKRAQERQFIELRR
jgi:hypothetical protein